jgi:uncharacterized membrane protein YdjX (TVP38/TMEM64 family)
MGIVQDFTSFLTVVAGDPILYSVLFFFYAVAAAVILPIPIEIGLLLSPNTPWYLLAIILGAGKAVGSVLVFRIGLEIEGPIRRWSKRFKFFGKLIDWCERFVIQYNYYALFVLLCIPFMSDTAVLYVFSITNKEGEALDMKWFALTNFMAGITRATIFMGLLYLGVDLFR